MHESSIKLIELINEGKTLNELTRELKISRNRLYNKINRLKNEGFEFDRKYYYNGEIKYIKDNLLQDKQISIITEKKNIFEAIVVSDTHLGSKNGRLDLLYKLYNYCIKENIHIIINCGDFLDGIYGTFPHNYDDIKYQIDSALEKYPFDKNILNFITLGDHDYYIYGNYGINLATILSVYRHDIVPLGFAHGKLNIKNDSIYINHPSKEYSKYNFIPNFGWNTKYIKLVGHSHHMKISCNPPNLIVYIPTFSDIIIRNDGMLPSCLKMKIEFLNGLIKSIEFNHLIFGNKIYTSSQYKYDLTLGKKFNNLDEVKFEEELPIIRKLTNINKLD